MFSLNIEEAIAKAAVEKVDVKDGENVEGDEELISFQDRKIIEYEIRIKQYSTPVKNSEVMMTSVTFFIPSSPERSSPSTFAWTCSSTL